MDSLTLVQLKLLQAAFRGDVVPKGSPEDLKSLESKEYGASFCFLELAKELLTASISVGSRGSSTRSSHSTATSRTNKIRQSSHSGLSFSEHP